MNAPSWGGWVLCAAVLTGGGSMLALQRSKLGPLRLELQIARDAKRELVRLRSEQERLKQEQPAAAELENLRADRAALVRLREELAAVKSNANSAALTPPARVDPGLQAQATRPASSWKNAGHSNPNAALETALWAAVGGDLDTLAATIRLDPNAQKEAEGILARLPPEARARYGSPENLVALFTAKDVPTTGSMRVIAENPLNENEVLLGVLFESEVVASDSGSPKRPAIAQSRTLRLRRDGTNWKLVVPGPAVGRYGAILAGTSTPGSDTK